MATQSDLMGLGMPGPLATLLGNTPTVVTGVGTTQATGATLRSMSSLVTAGGATAFTISANTTLSRLYFVFNPSSTTALIYPPSGAAIGAGATDAAFSLAQGKSVIIWRFSTTVFPAVLTA